MSFTTFLQQCLTGISLGGAYALIAIGYTLVYGILRLINFAHGDIFMMAGYFMIFAMASLPWFLAIPVTLLITVILGVSIERVAYRPLRSAPRMSVMISAIGVSYLLQNLATYLFTALPKGYPEIPFLKRIFQIGGLSASFVTFLTPVLTLVLVYLLILLINHTKIGMAMSACCVMVISVFMLLFAPQLMRIFSQDQEVISYGVSMLYTIAPAYLFISITQAIAGALRGAGKTLFPMAVIMLCWCGLRMAWILVGLQIAPVIRTVFLGYPISWIASTVLLLFCLKKLNWFHRTGY